MKYKTARLHGIAAASILLLLMLSATAFAYAGRSNTTSNPIPMELGTASTSAPSTQSEQNGENQELDYSLVAIANDTGSGEAKVQLSGTQLTLHLALDGARPNSTYTVQLIANGTGHIAGTATTDANGNAKSDGLTLQLPAGNYAIGVQLLLGGSISFQSDPVTQEGVLGEIGTTGTSSTTSTSTESSQNEAERQSETETSNVSQQQGTNENSTENQTGTNETAGNNNQQGANENHEMKFSLVPAAPDAKGQGEVNVDIHGLLMEVQGQVEKADANAQYSFVLTVNGTDHKLGTLVTDGEGDGEIQAEFKAANPGTYVIGVSLLQGSTLVLKGDPSSLKAVLVQSAPQNENQNQQGENVNVVQGNQTDEQQIENAKDNKTIPAVVQVTGSGATATVLDSKFSVSVGKIEGNGLAIQISGNNVTGPRTLLVNLSDTIDITSHSLVVTLDGKPVSQASAVTQVLSPSSSDPPRYIVVGTASGLQLLISIPHFSLHTIRLLPVPLTPPQGLLTINGITLVVSLVAVSVAFVAVFAARKRIYSLIA